MEENGRFLCAYHAHSPWLKIAGQEISPDKDRICLMPSETIRFGLSILQHLTNPLDDQGLFYKVSGVAHPKLCA